MLAASWRSPASWGRGARRPAGWSRRGAPATSTPAARCSAWRAAGRWAAPALLCLSAPAVAGTAATITLASDQWFRGHSITEERPTATIGVAYDDRSGAYLGFSADLVASRDEGIEPLLATQYAGYARRLGGVTADAGVVNRVYSRYYDAGARSSYVEGYVGLTTRRMAARLFWAPRYYGRPGSAVYGQVEALIVERPDWSLSGQVGALAPSGARRGTHHLAVDGRLTVTRRLGRLGASLSAVGGGRDNRGEAPRGTVILALSRSF